MIILERAALDGVALDRALAEERARLVALCARLTGNVDAAEDLAQETLVEAWRSQTRLRNADGLTPWLSAIARNVCLRWQRAHGRDMAHRALLSPLDAAGEGDMAGVALDELAVDDTAADLTLTLERDELATLLDRALGLLPVETRAALVASYVDELPQAEVAARLGMSEGALRARLHRGKLALRQALETDLREEARALDVQLPAADQERQEWCETRIWCPFCGRGRLLLRMGASVEEVTFRCMHGCTPGGGMIMGRCSIEVRQSGLTSAKSLLARQALLLGDHYQQAIASGERCQRCGALLAVQVWTPENAPFMENTAYGIYLPCAQCGADDSASLWHLALDTLTAQRFWRRHPRMQALPIRLISFGGRPALLTGFANYGGSERVEVISDGETLATLHIAASDTDGR